MDDDSTNTTEEGTPEISGSITGDQPGTGGGGRAATAERVPGQPLVAGDQPGTGGGGVTPIEPSEPTGN